MEEYIIANCTDVGVARSVNEDSMVTFDSPNGRVVAVCDGMGGQAAGDVASQLACSIIRDILENNTFANPNEAIERAVVAANQGILHRAAQQPELSGMGATCVMVIVRDGLVYYGWVGDSRIYYIANHTIRQISRDQSYVQQLVDRGELSPEEAENHPQKNEITNALGVAGMTPPVIGKPMRPEAGSVILLCSDGLTGMVDNAHIERTISNTDLTLHDRARKLIAQANANGGLDNITVQLIQFLGNSEVASRNERRKKSISTVTLVSCIIGAVLVLGAAAWFCFFKDSEEAKEPAKTEKTGGTSGTVSSGTSDGQPSSAASQAVGQGGKTTTTIVIDEPAKQPDKSTTINAAQAVKNNNKPGKSVNGDKGGPKEQNNSYDDSPVVATENIEKI